MDQDDSDATAVVPKVLWVDDDPDFLESIRDLMILAEMPLDIDIAVSRIQAEIMLSKCRYSAIVADYCLDELDRGSNTGAQLLADLTRTSKQLPKFAFSAFLDDPLYRADASKAELVASADKDTEWPHSGLAEVAFFVKLYRAAGEYSKVAALEPERLSFERYIRNPAQYAELMATHWTRNGAWITRELKSKGLLWGVFCGTTLVDGSRDLADFPSEEKLKIIGKAHNLVPFAYSLPTPIETVQWSHTTYSHDRFPRIKIRLRQLHTDDFDTGAAQTYISSELVALSPFDALRKDYHLGKEYWATTKVVDMVLVAHDGAERSYPLTVVVVKNWSATGFVDVNTSRKVLIGRDVLRFFHVEILLNSKTGESKVSFI